MIILFQLQNASAYFSCNFHEGVADDSSLFLWIRRVAQQLAPSKIKKKQCLSGPHASGAF